MNIFFNLNVYITLSVALVALVGDYLITLCANLPLAKALCDNITHGIIGGLCWGICYLNRDKMSPEILGNGFVEIFACTILSSVIDLDHFVAAKSILLKNATSLTHRPLLHCSTIPAVLCSAIIFAGYICNNPYLKRGALIVLTAFATHHIRDATRRGLWFYPYGSTPPIPYKLYILLLCTVPYVIITVDKLLMKNSQRESVEYLV